MSRISQNELETLETISSAFPKEAISRSGMDRKAIMAAFIANTSMLQKVSLAMSKLWYQAARSNDARAKRLVRYCEKNVPPLMRVFGQDALVEAMRTQPTRSEAIASLSERLGGAKIASLIRQSLCIPN